MRKSSLNTASGHSALGSDKHKRGSHSPTSRKPFHVARKCQIVSLIKFACDLEREAEIKHENRHLLTKLVQIEKKKSVVAL